MTGFQSVLAPRLLTRQQAAAYCSVSLPTFEACCPVHAVSLGGSKRLDRYDVRDLDTWIDGLRAGPAEKTAEEWLAALG